MRLIIRTIILVAILWIGVLLSGYGVLFHSEENVGGLGLKCRRNLFGNICTRGTLRFGRRTSKGNQNTYDDAANQNFHLRYSQCSGSATTLDQSSWKRQVGKGDIVTLYGRFMAVRVEIAQTFVGSGRLVLFPDVGEADVQPCVVGASCKSLSTRSSV